MRVLPLMVNNYNDKTNPSFGRYVGLDVLPVKSFYALKENPEFDKLCRLWESQGHDTHIGLGMKYYNSVAKWMWHLDISNGVDKKFTIYRFNEDKLAEGIRKFSVQDMISSNLISRKRDEDSELLRESISMLKRHFLGRKSKKISKSSF